MRSRIALLLLFVIITLTPHTVRAAKPAKRPQASSAASSDRARLKEYVDAVTRGAGLLPGQDKEPSDTERLFRQNIERRKDEMLAARSAIQHPVLLTDAQVEQARRNIASADWAKSWYRAQLESADKVVAQDDDYVERMIPELTPTNIYGFTCPNCVGSKSQECVGHSLIKWDEHHPDVLACRACGQEYPSEKYPETARLVCPRTGQTFTFYLNDQERAHPDDRSGKYAWHWVSRPVHVSFAGVIRGEKISFMLKCVSDLSLAYRMTGEPRYARRAIQILVRFAHCYRNWLYHDYWGTIADCDPMYAAWHDKALPLEFKRHLCADAFKGDTPAQARMLQTYWGAGRIHPSTDSISNLVTLIQAYDSLYNVRDKEGKSLWSDEDRAWVERDLLLEYEMGAEPFVGGANAATAVNNKSPPVYLAQAVLAQCLGLPRMADTALRGYEGVRDQSFLYDGFSKESPAYTSMYLSGLTRIPEALHGFRWPAQGPREGVVDLYASDPRLRLMYRATVDQLRPDGQFVPLSDTMVGSSPNASVVELGLKRYPEYYAGKRSALIPGKGLTDYAIFNLSPEQIADSRGLDLPEILFPAWGTALLRHGNDPDASMLAMAFSPPGGHRHDDNLSLYYVDRGRTILGDLGYVGDMPLNNWIHSTFSHNLVIVDDAAQRGRSGGKPRKPRFCRMFTSPRLSLVEAASEVYEQCHEYRRLVAMMKGPGSQSFAIDIFRVKGGDRHDYRLFSELASSDAPKGGLVFTDLDIPPAKPLPQVGASLEKADIYGLRDVRGADRPPTVWQATWQEPRQQYRVWMLTSADRVEASNGPGQETRQQAGRRVRCLDVLREGKNINSTFVAIHEPSGSDGKMPIQHAERLDVPSGAGPDAVAIRVTSSWGTYLVLSEFAQPTEIAGVRFHGAFGVLNQTADGSRWLIASGTRAFMADGLGFENAIPSWSGKILTQTDTELTAETAAPPEFRERASGLTTYVQVATKEGLTTGFGVQAVKDKRIAIDRFPLPPSTEFSLDNVRYLEKHPN